MNSIKALEADSGELFTQIGQIEGVDSRLLALAKTNLQQGFMWFVRSIAKPADPFGSADERRHSLAPRAADKPILGVHPTKPVKLLIVRTPQVLSDVQRTQQLSRYQIAADQVGACLLLLDGGAAASLE